MAVAKHAPNHQAAAAARDLKHRILTCLNKLSDRDTHSAAAGELESIARALPPDSIPPFISSISATDAADKSPVRKQCVRLLSLLSEAHGDALSPHLSKILHAVVRRLRDPDSAVRAACVAACGSISSHVTRPPFTSILKPLVDALVTEQDQNSQIGAALCLSSAIDGSPDPEPAYLRKLLPRLEKLLRSESFKAKPALLTLVASIVGAGSASSHQVLKNLVPCLVEFVSSEDWAARKAAAEALTRLAVVEEELLPEFKASYLKTFETKRFDKVKIVRETMNQMVEAWKEIPDIGDDVLAPAESQSPCKDPSDGRYPPGSKTSRTVTYGAPLIGKKNTPTNRSSLPDGSITTTARKRSPLDTSDKKKGLAMFRKLDRKKTTDWKVDIATPHTPSAAIVCEDNSKGTDEKILEKSEERNRFMKPETRRVLFNKNAEDRTQKFGGLKTGSRVVPCHDEKSESTVVASNGAEDLNRNQKESEDLSLIRNQLVQIETQQSNLLDLLQNFIGSSQNGMHSLETRVHGLELALDEISYDLAVSNRRMSSAESTCCKIPGAEFLTSKFWRRTEIPASRLSSFSGTQSLAATRRLANKNGGAETFRLENRRLRLQNGGGFIMNPLAEIHGDSQGNSEISSGRVLNNGQGVA